MSLAQKLQFPMAFPNVLAATANLTPAGVTTNTTNVASTITVPGAAVGDVVLAVTTPAALGSVLLQGEVTAANTVTLKFSNLTAGTITPPAGNYTAIVLSKDPVMLT